MRIDIKNQTPKQASSKGNQKTDSSLSSFKAALDTVSRGRIALPLPQPVQQHSPPIHYHLHLELQSDVLEQEIEFDMAVETQELENHKETVESKLEIKEALSEDLVLDESIENKDEIETFIEEAMDQEEERLEELREGDELEDSSELEKELDGSDDALDLSDDLLPESEKEQEDDHLQEDDESDSKAEDSESSAYIDLTELSQDRDMSFQEVQDLVHTVLSANKALPPRLVHLLNRVLNQLVQGQRLLIDQHEMVGLNEHEWHILAGLFPPRFFGGFIRPLIQQSSKDTDRLTQTHRVFQDILHQVPLTQSRFDILDQLYQISLPEYQVHQALWKKDDVSVKEIKNWIELGSQRGLSLPGATGQIQKLALDYHHHADRSLGLFQMSGVCFRGGKLTSEDTEVLSDTLYERCFSHLNYSQPQVSALLQNTLKGEPLDTKETLLLIQGSAQGVLSYLPYSHSSDALQELLELVYTDPHYKEDKLLSLFAEDEDEKFVPSSGERRM